MKEYEQLKATGLTDHTIKMLRNTGASHAAILLYANQQRQRLCLPNTLEEQVLDLPRGTR